MFWCDTGPIGRHIVTRLQFFVYCSSRIFNYAIVEKVGKFLFLSLCSSELPSTREPNRKNMGKPGRFPSCNPYPCLRGKFQPVTADENSLQLPSREQRARARATTFDGESLKEQFWRLPQFTMRS